MKKILNDHRNSSGDSFDQAIVPTTVLPSEIVRGSNSEDTSSNSNQQDVMKNNTSGFDTKNSFNGEQPDSLDNEGKNENQKINQEVGKILKKSERLLTEKADLIQNGAYNESSFDIGSFIGGMVLAIVLSVICVFGVRYYKMRGSRNYNYLLWGESNA